MTLPPVFGSDLLAMLDGPLGADVVVGAKKFRGILTSEYRMQDDPNGMAQQVWTTVLTVRDRDLPATLREGQTLVIGGISHTLRRKGRVDDMGAREMFVVERTT